VVSALPSFISFPDHPDDPDDEASRRRDSVGVSSSLSANLLEIEETSPERL